MKIIRTRLGNVTIVRRMFTDAELRKMPSKDREFVLEMSKLSLEMIGSGTFVNKFNKPKNYETKSSSRRKKAHRSDRE